jgi:hypothetical protein
MQMQWLLPLPLGGGASQLWQYLACPMIHLGDRQSVGDVQWMGDWETRVEDYDTRVRHRLGLSPVSNRGRNSVPITTARNTGRGDGLTRRHRPCLSSRMRRRLGAHTRAPGDLADRSPCCGALTGNWLGYCCKAADCGVPAGAETETS